MGNCVVNGAPVGFKRAGRFQAGAETGQVAIGDFGYADDTGICGEADEVVAAEQLFSVVCGDWEVEERVHPRETAGLRLAGAGNAATDTPHFGEAPVVEHVGGGSRRPGRLLPNKTK